MALTIGVISDTHGLMRREALDALRGVGLILHAGDIGSLEVIEQLEGIAPVRAVRGNNDRESWAERFPETDVVEIGSKLVYLLHDIKMLDLDPRAAGMAAVIAGHSHQPSISQKNGVLYLNPGSAGPRRFKLPVSLAVLHDRGDSFDPRLITLG